MESGNPPDRNVGFPVLFLELSERVFDLPADVNNGPGVQI
jgi:hypothetical protein